MPMYEVLQSIWSLFSNTGKAAVLQWLHTLSCHKCFWSICQTWVTGQLCIQLANQVTVSVKQEEQAQVKTQPWLSLMDGLRSQKSSCNIRRAKVMCKYTIHHKAYKGRIHGFPLFHPFTLFVSSPRSKKDTNWSYYGHRILFKKQNPHFLAHANGQNAITQEVNLRMSDLEMSNDSKWITSFKHNLALWSYLIHRKFYF